MPLNKRIITIIAICSLLINASGQNDPNNLSQYYGFGEMEIIKLDWDIKALSIADFNGDLRDDIAVVNNRKAKIELLIQKKEIGPQDDVVEVDPNDADINLINPPTRFDKQSVSVSQEVFSLTCGDLNADGMIDLAFYGKPKGLYVILQKAGEEKKTKAKTLSWQTRKKIELDDGLPTSNALVCADLNNDSIDDLALAGRQAVFIILQKKEGSLAEPVKYPTTALIRGVRIADLNGDNINDLILITNDIEKPIHARFGLETGQFGPEERFFIENPKVLELYNIDGQTGDELLMIDRSKPQGWRLACYKLDNKKNKDADWPVSFYPLASNPQSSKRDLVIADITGDRLDDVVISEPGAAELVLYKQLPSLGLAEPVKFPTFADITGLCAVDIDSDGKAEIAALSIKEKVIGLSRFEDNRLSFPKPLQLFGEPVGMELADMDNDQLIDCVYISKDPNDLRSLRVIYNMNVATGGNKKKAKASKQKTTKKKLLEVTGDEAFEKQTPLELKKLISNPDGMKVLDVDQDSLKDILIFVKYEPPILVRQVSKGAFEVIDSPDTQASLIKDASLSSIEIANVDDKPGDELLIAQKNFARSLVFAEGTTWTVVDQYNAKSTENLISAVAGFHIDGGKQPSQPAILLLDGQKGQLQILKTDDDKTYRLEKELDIGKWETASHLKMLFAPLTGGKVKSILLFDSQKFALITPPTSNKGFPTLEQQFIYETKIKDGAYGNLAAGDINSDERADITMVEYMNNHIEILALDSELKPTPAMRFKVFEHKSYHESQSQYNTEPRELTIADVTGDGKADLITIIHDRIIIYPQD